MAAGVEKRRGGGGVRDEPRTASFQRMPAEHDGTTFTFRVKFSADAEVSPRVLRETGFDGTGGRVRRAPRLNGRDDLRETHVEPSGHGTVSIALPATTRHPPSAAVELLQTASAMAASAMIRATELVATYTSSRRFKCYHVRSRSTSGGERHLIAIADHGTQPLSPLS